jgi:hypothetical protein
MSIRNFLYIAAQLTEGSEPSVLAQSFYSRIRDAGPILKWLTDDCRERRNTTYRDAYGKSGGVAENVATNGARVVYMSIDRVSEDQAKRIAASLATRRVELWDRESVRQVLVDILGADFETESVPLTPGLGTL